MAGVDLQTRRHVRPMLANDPLPFYLLARYGGPFEMAMIVDLGSPRAAPVAPHIEDHVFVPARAKAERLAAAHEFWSVLQASRAFCQPGLASFMAVLAAVESPAFSKLRTLASAWMNGG